MMFPTRFSRDRQRFLAFWSRFIEDLQLDDKSQTIKPPAPSQNQPFHMPKGTNAWISAALIPSSGKAGVFLTFGRGSIGDRLYSALVADRESISKALGVPAEWKSKDQKHVIETLKSFSGSIPEDHPDELRLYLADVLNRYINVFKPRLERLMEHR